MNRFDLAKAQAFIREGNDFLVVSHVQPDGDAVSSTLAMGHLLGMLGKSCTMAIADRVPGKLHYLPDVDQIKLASEAEPPARQYDRIIAVDCADYSRIGSADRWFTADARILNIDHHPTNDGYGDVCLINTEAAATAEILYTLISAMGVSWNKALADCIYTGILTDTGGFRYNNTTPATLRIASEMLDHGTDGHLLADGLLEKFTHSHVRLLQRALGTLSFAAGDRISWVKVTLQDMAETDAANEDLEGLVNYPRNIDGVEVGLLFKEVDPGKVKVSLRSSGNVDVAAFAQSWGGGGHVRAAGLTVNKPLEEAEQLIIASLVELMA